MKLKQDTNWKEFKEAMQEDVSNGTHQFCRQADIYIRGGMTELYAYYFASIDVEWDYLTNKLEEKLRERMWR